MIQSRKLVQARRFSRPISAVAFGSFASGTISLGVLGLAPEIAAEFQLQVNMGGALVAAHALPIALFAPLLALASRRTSHIELVIAGLGLAAAGAFLCAAAASVSQLLIARAVSGIGALMFSASAPAIAAALVPLAQRARALSYVIVGLTLAPLVGVPMAAWCGVQFGWRVTFFALGVVTVIAMALAGITLTAERRNLGAPNGIHAGIREIIDRSYIRWGLATTILHLGARFALFAPIAGLLTEYCGVDRAALPAALFVFGLGGFLGNLAGGELSDRFGHRRTIWCSIAGLAVAGCLLLGDIASQTAIGLLAVCAGTGALFTSAQQVELMHDASPDIHRAILTLNSIALALGMGGGALLGGTIAVTLGYQAVIISSLLLLFMAAMASYLATTPNRIPQR